MSKPEWLKDKEAEHPERVFRKCYQCVHFFGQRIGTTKHKSVEKVEVWECAIHPGCLNTKYSICCDDYNPR